jgi:hypothetical protein
MKSVRLGVAAGAVRIAFELLETSLKCLSAASCFRSRRTHALWSAADRGPPHPTGLVVCLQQASDRPELSDSIANGILIGASVLAVLDHAEQQGQPEPWLCRLARHLAVIR